LDILFTQPSPTPAFFAVVGLPETFERPLLCVAFLPNTNSSEKVVLYIYL
jgi:hypothetical protein